VVVRGFDALTENLLPIYQSVDHLVANVKPFSAKPKKSGPKSIKGKPTTGKKSDTNTRTGRATEYYDKLQGAPAPNLDFPLGNLTIAEMAAFHPEALKSWDVIDRYCGNGGTQAAFATMINHFRVMARGPIPNNSVYRMMKGSMQQRAKVEERYKDWTAGSHHQYHDEERFDPASVSITGFRTAADGRNKSSAAPIPIKDLAIGVKTFPTGNDALDLTRAVQYCLAHPDEVWMYPTDYERLVNQLPQDARFAKYPAGPAPVQAAHHDSAVINRYTSAKVAAGLRNVLGRKRDSHGRPRKKKLDSGESDAVDTGSEHDSDMGHNFDNKRKSFFYDSDDDELRTPSRKRSNKRSKALHRFSGVLDSESEPDAFRGTKRTKKVKEVRRSTRATKVTNYYSLEAVDLIEDNDDDSDSDE
jgi:hypothetical protein